MVKLKVLLEESAKDAADLDFGLFELSSHLAHEFVLEVRARVGRVQLLVERDAHAAQRRRLLAQRRVRVPQRARAAPANLCTRVH